MAKVYFIACPIGTICDTVNVTLAGWNERFIQPCIPDLLDNGVSYFTKDEDYVVEFSDNDPLNFREVNWKNKVNKLKRFVETQNKNVIVGSYKPEQLDIIKKTIPTVSISIDYTSEQQELVIRDVIKLSAMHNDDKYKTMDYKDLKRFVDKEYQNKRTVLEMFIPKTFSVDADYHINIADLFVKDKFIDFIETIDGKRNKKQLDFYDKWLYNNKHTTEVFKNG